MKTNASRLGTTILAKISCAFSSSTASRPNIQMAESAMLTDKWDPNQRSLKQFTRDFSENTPTLQTQHPPPSPSQLRDWWIGLLPEQFTQVKTDLHKNDLKQPWATSIYDVQNLADATEQGINACSLNIPR